MSIREMEPSAHSGTAAETSGLRGNLGAPSITFMVLAAAAPLTVVGALMPAGFSLGNGAGFPAMFLIATVILLLFSVGLMAMSRALPDAGAFFTYISNGLGRVPGVAAAYLAVICYSTVQVAVLAIFGGTMSANIASMGGPAIPWWLIALLGTVAVGFLGYRRIELSSKVLVVLLLAEMSIVLILAVAVIVSGGANGINLDNFSIGNLLSGSPSLGLMFAVGGFIGFESTVVYRREVKNPNQTIPKATYGSAIVIGVFYAFAAWILVMAVGTSNVATEAATYPTTLLTRVTGQYLGPIGSSVVSILFLGSMFAAVLSLHNVIARYLHSMASAQLLPTRVGAVHSRHGSPHISSLVQVFTAAAIVVVVAILQVSPENVLAWFAGIGTLSIVILMAATCLAVIVFFARQGAGNPLRTIIAPGLGLVGLLISIWLIAENFPLLVGDVDAKGNPAWGTVSVTLLLVIVLAPIVGVAQSLAIRGRDKTAYARITQTLDQA